MRCKDNFAGYYWRSLSTHIVDAKLIEKVMEGENMGQGQS